MVVDLRVCKSAFEEYMNVCPMFPSEKQAESANNAMNDYLAHCKALKREMEHQERKLYHIVPKHHMAQHLGDNFLYMNPKYHWTFKAEDFVGKISKLAHSCSFGVGKHKLSAKLMQKYRIMVHLALTRGF